MNPIRSTHFSFLLRCAVCLLLSLLLVGVGYRVALAEWPAVTQPQTEYNPAAVERTIPFTLATDVTASEPDDFGYTYKTSADPDGPVYAWEEISGISEPIIPVNKSIGFEFPFYGNLYEEFYFSLHGYIAFDSDANLFLIPEYGIPDGYSPNNQISIFGDNGYTMLDTHFYLATLQNPTRRVFEVVNLRSHHDSVTYQVILYPSGDILIQYKDLTTADHAIIGIENQGGTDGLMVSEFPTNAFAIRFYAPSGPKFHPERSLGFAEAGGLARHRVQLENRSPVMEAYYLQGLPGNQWPLWNPLPESITLTPNQKLDLDLQVLIPSDALPGDFDVMHLLATSVVSPEITATITLTTTATSGQIGHILVPSITAGVEQKNYYLQEIDLQMRNLAGHIPIDPDACDGMSRIAVPPNGKSLWVTCQATNRVLVFDRQTYQIQRWIENVPTAYGIVFDLDGRYAYVGSFSSNQVTVIDTRTYSLTYLPVSGKVYELAAHPYLPYVYVTNWSNNLLTVIDARTRSVLTTIKLGSTPYYANVSHDGRRLYTGNPSNDTISVVDTQTNQWIDTIVVGVNGSGQLSNVLTNLEDSKIFANMSAGPYDYTRLDVIDAASGMIEDHIAPPNSEWLTASALNCLGNELYALNPGLFKNSENHLTIFDTSTYAILQQLKMPDRDEDGYFDRGVIDLALCPQTDARPLLQPSSPVFLVEPGETTVFTLTLENRWPSASFDSYDLEISGSSWSANLSVESTGPLAWGEVFTFTLTVETPVELDMGSWNHIQLVARAERASDNQTIVHIISAYTSPVYLPQLVK